ncbi:MAG: GtrA family protein [Hylemonella sp.]|uniref:GtrA family protein n=1 Tax=Hylemonella sp. TaxID=2066020 RepID=UPI0022BC9F52|nr:GtrA family protein [Hylemonella sp.]MCZ8253618.1 GtrA family protein [Hylemonella sp.]
MTSPTLRDRLWQLVDWLHGFRYVRFGLVGASGTVVNLVVLYFAHEYLFRAIEPVGSKPYFSLALAIAVATVNNFTWNRLWTWSDRQHATAVEEGERLRKRSLLAQLGQYATASWLGILLQYALTLWLTHLGLHYLVANVTAIVIASVSNFIANDRWTFRHKRSP